MSLEPPTYIGGTQYVVRWDSGWRYEAITYEGGCGSCYGCIRGQGGGRHRYRVWGDGGRDRVTEMRLGR